MTEEPRRRILVGVVVFATIVLAATAYYTLVEDFGFIDALYQTIITVSTVGFGEVAPLDDRGRAFTIGVILVGVGAGFYALSGVFEYAVGRQIGRSGRRRLQRQLASMSDHAIVCGYGRIGAKVTELLHDQLAVVVIDQDPTRVLEAREDGFLTVEGDAADDDVLGEVGLDRARILITALPTDADNLYVVLSGRALNKDLHIVSRAQHSASGAKLIRAGADRVVNPEDIGAHRLAAFALRPTVSEFLDVVMRGASVEYRMEDVRIDSGSRFVGKTLREADFWGATGATVLAVKQPSGQIVTNPNESFRLDGGTTLIAFGTQTELDALARAVD